MGSRDGAARLLLVALLVGVVADIAASVTGVVELSLGWLAGFALLVLAVRHPGMAHPEPVRSAARLATVWRFVVLLALACLVSPVLVLTHATQGEATQAAVVLGGAVFLFTLALLRIVSLLVAAAPNPATRARAARRPPAPLVGAADRGGVRDAALEAALELLDQPGSRAWRVDGDPGGTVAQATDDDDVATFLDSAELALLPGLRGGHRRPAPVRPCCTPPSVCRRRHTLVLVALPARGVGPGGRRGRRRAAAVAAYGRGAAVPRRRRCTLALERLDVGEIMVERRSERRLRLMLQYASDVICILDHDLTIVHVTPAVEPIVGMPAPELLGMNWLDVVADVRPRQPPATWSAWPRAAGPLAARSGSTPRTATPATSTPS